LRAWSNAKQAYIPWMVDLNLCSWNKALCVGSFCQNDGAHFEIFWHVVLVFKFFQYLITMSKQNTILLNAHAVPFTDLITVNTVLVVGVALALARYLKLNTWSTASTVGGFLVASVLLHPRMGIPDNLSYYFGMGKKPTGWRGETA